LHLPTSATAAILYALDMSDGKRTIAAFDLTSGPDSGQPAADGQGDGAGSGASSGPGKTVVVVLVVLVAWVVISGLSAAWDCGLPLLIALGVAGYLYFRRPADSITRVELTEDGLRFLRATGSSPPDQLDWPSVHWISTPSLGAGGLVDLRIGRGFFSPEWIVVRQPAHVAHTIAAAIHAALARITGGGSATEAFEKAQPENRQPENAPSANPHPADDPGPPCIACGYDRTGIETDIPCPECGAPPVRAAITCRVSTSTMSSKVGWTNSESTATVHEDGIAIAFPEGQVRNIDWPTIISLQASVDPEAASIQIDIKAVVTTMAAKTSLHLPVASGHRLAAAIHDRLAAWHARQPAPA